MKVLTIKQPWAWAIIHGGKDLENRNWFPSDKVLKVGERFAVQASKGLTRYEYNDAWTFMQKLGFASVTPPLFEDLERGGIIGTVQYDGYVREHETDSPWFMGKYGLKLSDPQPCEFKPIKGRLGFFETTKDMGGE